MTDIPGPGKFEKNKSATLAEYLHTLSMEGEYDEQFGDVETIGWFCIMRSVDKPNIEAHLHSLYATQPEVAWHYILEENVNGFFKYWPYDTLEEVNKAWETIKRMYNG